jgi:hypothetical protein
MSENVQTFGKSIDMSAEELSNLQDDSLYDHKSKRQALNSKAYLEQMNRILLVNPSINK